MKKFLSGVLAVSFALVGAAPAAAESESDYNKSYTSGDIESIEAERYWQIDKKWKVEVEFDDSKDYEFYVYNIDDKNELINEIQDGIRDHFGFRPISSFVSEILEYDADDFFASEDENEIDEIEAEPYENIEGKWEIEVEYENGKDKKFYVYDVEDKNDLVSKIAKELGVSENEVEESLDVDYDELEKEAEDEKDEKDEKEEKDEKDYTEDKKEEKENQVDNNKQAQIEALEKQIQELLNLLIALLTKQLSL